MQGLREAICFRRAAILHNSRSDCHAEKQLMAYLVSHLVSKSESGTIEWEKKIAPVETLISIKNTQIVVSAPICSDCKEFAEAVGNFYSISFLLHYPGTTQTK